LETLGQTRIFNEFEPDGIHPDIRMEPAFVARRSDYQGSNNVSLSIYPPLGKEG
jgi:hypothetical protein